MPVEDAWKFGNLHDIIQFMLFQWVMDDSKFVQTSLICLLISAMNIGMGLTAKNLMDEYTSTSKK